MHNVTSWLYIHVGKNNTWVTNQKPLGILVTSPPIGAPCCWNNASETINGLQILLVQVILITRQHVAGPLVGTGRAREGPDVVRVLLPEFGKLLHGERGTGVDKLKSETGIDKLQSETSTFYRGWISFPMSIWVILGLQHLVLVVRCSALEETKEKASRS